MIKVSLTFDTDWVHESALDYLIGILDNYNQEATFFATNEYRVFLTNGFCHEIGIHPNFNYLLTNGITNYESIINELFQIYPKSKGFRSHSLTTSSLILNYIHELGFVYDSNQFHPLGAALYQDYSKLFRFTHNYVDLGHLMDGSKLTFHNMNLSTMYLNVFDFHPIHIFLNTPTIEFYNEHKHLTSSSKLGLFRNTNERGVGDLFIELLDYLKENKIVSKKLISCI